MSAPAFDQPEPPPPGGASPEQPDAVADSVGAETKLQDGKQSFREQPDELKLRDGPAGDSPQPDAQDQPVSLLAAKAGDERYFAELYTTEHNSLVDSAYMSNALLAPISRDLWREAAEECLLILRNVTKATERPAWKQIARRLQATRSLIMNSTKQDGSPLLSVPPRLARDLEHAFALSWVGAPDGKGRLCVLLQNQDEADRVSAMSLPENLRHVALTIAFSEVWVMSSDKGDEPFDRKVHGVVPVPQEQVVAVRSLHVIQRASKALVREVSQYHAKVLKHFTGTQEQRNAFFAEQAAAARFPHAAVMELYSALCVSRELLVSMHVDERCRARVEKKVMLGVPEEERELMRSMVDAGLQHAAKSSRSR